MNHRKNCRNHAALLLSTFILYTACSESTTLSIDHTAMNKKNLSTPSACTAPKGYIAGSGGVLEPSTKNPQLKKLTIKPNTVLIYKDEYKDNKKIIEVDFTQAHALKTICESAFAESNNIQVLEIPASVETIGKKAFRSAKIRKLSFAHGSRLKTIGEEAFSSAFLKKYPVDIEIPASVETIGKKAFYGAEIKKFSFAHGSRLKTIGEEAFSSAFLKKYPVDIEIPASVETIGKKAFRSAKIRKLSFAHGSRLKIITEDFIADNSELEELEIPAVMKKITTPFLNDNFPKLKTLRFVTGSQLEEIGSRVFYKSAIENLTIPASVKAIGYKAFYGNAIENLTIPASVKAIGEGAFAKNPLIKVVIHPYDVQIGSGAFRGYYYLNYPRGDMKPATVKAKKIEIVTLPQFLFQTLQNNNTLDDIFGYPKENADPSLYKALYDGRWLQCSFYAKSNRKDYLNKDYNWRTRDPNFFKNKPITGDPYQFWRFWIIANVRALANCPEMRWDLPKSTHPYEIN